LALIKIVRDSCFYDRFRAYDIVLDGNTVGEVRDGETWEFSVLNGRITFHSRSVGADQRSFSSAPPMELY